MRSVSYCSSQSDSLVIGLDWIEFTKTTMSGIHGVIVRVFVIAPFRNCFGATARTSQSRATMMQS